MSDQQVIDILQGFEGYLIEDNILLSCLRWIGWWIIKVLASLVNTLEGAIKKVIGLTDFFESPEINKLISDFKPAIFMLLALSLACVGLFIFFSKKFDKKSVPTNIFLATMAIMLLPFGMSKLNELTQAGVDVVYGEFKSMANETIKNNIIDVYKFDENNFTSKDVNPKNYISKEKITMIDINESIDKSQTKNEKVFENKVVPKKGGGYELKRIDGMFKIDNYYYRWKCNFGIIIVSLLATGATLLLSILKIGRLVFELAFNKVFGILMAYIDIANGQRLKKVIQRIITLFAVIFCMALMLKIYLIFTSWIGNKNLGIIEIIMMVVVSLAVIDGPNIVEEILGVDAGLSSAWKTIAGLYAGTKMGGELAKGVGKAATGLAKFGEKAAMGVAGGLGFATGARDGIKNNKLENQMDKKKADDKAKNNEGSLENQMKDSGLNIKDGSPNNNNKGETNEKDGIKSNEQKGELLEKADNKPNSKEFDNLNKAQKEKAINQNNSNDIDKDKNTPGENLKNADNADIKNNNSNSDKEDLLSKQYNKSNGKPESLNNENPNRNNNISNEALNKSTGERNIGKGNDSLSVGDVNSVTKDSIPKKLDKQSSDSMLSGERSNMSMEDTSISNKGTGGETLNAQSRDSVFNDGSSIPMEDTSMRNNSSAIVEPLNKQSSGIIDDTSINNKGTRIDTLNTQSNPNVASKTIVDNLNSGGGSNVEHEVINSPSQSEIATNESINTPQTSNVNKSEEVSNKVVETRTISEYVKDEFKKTRVGKSSIKVKRVYEIGKNSGVKYSEKKINKKGKGKA